MEMDMKYGLSGIQAVIDDHPITAFLKSPPGSDGLGNEEEMAD